MTPWTVSASWAPSELGTAAATQAASPLPSAREYAFEAYLYAALSACGWFVEANTREYDVLDRQLFECDAVLRKPYAEPGLRLLALEAKSGGWGAGDVIQLLGRARYIEAEGAVFGYRRSGPQGDWEQRVTPRLRRLGMRSVHVLDVDQPTPEQVLSAVYAGLGVTPRPADPVCFTSSLYGHLLQAWLRPTWKPLLVQHPGSAALLAARKWNVRVYENLPLVASPVDRLARQEESFREFGRLLALRVAQDLGLVRRDATRLSSAMIDGGENRTIQAALLLQHIARLALMATVVEIVHLLPSSQVQALATGADARLADHWRARVASLRQHPGSARWPLLWQTYLARWGGFLVHERRYDEMELIADEVGMTADEVDAGLGAFDTFFPQSEDRSWHVRTRDGLEVLTLVPAALRGVGVYHRLTRRGLYELDGQGRAMVAETLQVKYGVNGEAAARLARWHDIGVRTLLGQTP